MISGRQFKKKGVYVGLVSAVVVLGALVAFAASKKSAPISYGIVGAGTGQLTDASCESIACDTNDTCACLTGTDPISNGYNLSFTLSIDETNSSVSTGGLRISNVGYCYPATGTAALVGSRNKAALTYNLSGLVCATLADTDVFSGTYVITGGEGKFATTSGVGSLNLSQALPSGVSQISLVGSVQP